MLSRLSLLSTFFSAAKPSLLNQVAYGLSFLEAFTTTFLKPVEAGILSKSRTPTINFVLATQAQAMQSPCRSLKFNEFQMLERQIKQLQELQRQKQLQELNDAHQQNAIHHNKYSSVTQYGMLNNGVQVRDASQMFVFGDTNLVHGLPNRLVYSQPQNQVLHAQFQGHFFSQGGGQTRKAQKVNNQDRYKEFCGIQESGMEYVSGNQDLATLDPLEQKVLFNMGDNMFDKTKKSSLQSGSWSALMQTAVAEASNGDSGVQEERSGLSFQNPELSNENQPSNMVELESGKQQTPWLYNNLPEEVTFRNSDCSGMSDFLDRSTVSVKKEDGEKKSTFEVKTGIGQQVASSRRQSNKWVDVPMQQNPPTPSTSYPANRKMESGKMHQSGNHGHAVSSFGCSLKQAPMNYDPRIIKKERVEYDDIVPQVTSLSHFNPACGNYKSQPISSSATRSSSIYLQQLDVAKKNMVVLKSKKRKVSTFEQLPWYKEVTEGCTRLHDTSNAELEWAHSVNRMPEKVADLMSIVDRKRRRLILTTQLMQMTSRSSVEQGSLLKVVEGFIDRSKRLEDMLLRWEKEGSSIVDIKVEFQDLEKFSVINRFAKFHSRGPLVTTTDTSSSGGASSTMQKLNPQRYVTASEMPSVVPQGQYCLPL
ncbi:unnamed protein product [Lactuca virosa]|uniref:Uncharacterized protein n=1 Tax=Lactuca virosa TaxID=75947 RepID=A0AAU9NIE3_9ASTR|nr:unnamed protein product [Lactuca virosa]